MSKDLKKLSVTGLQNLRSVSSHEDIADINAIIMAKLRGEKSIAPFVVEISYSYDVKHKNSVLSIFELRSAFMSERELNKLTKNNDSAYSELRNSISTVNDLSLEDAMIARGEGDYEKIGMVSKIM